MATKSTKINIVDGHDAAGRARYRAVVGDVTATRATVVRLLADWTDSASIEPWQALVSSDAPMAIGERVHLYAGRIARQSRVGADPSVAYLD